MPIDPELAAEMQRRGLTPAATRAPAMDPELAAEMQRRGLTPGSSPQRDPIGSDIGRQLAAVGRGGKWLNDKIQGMVGTGVEKTAQNFGPTVGGAAAFGAALPAGLIQAGLPKNKEEAGSMLLPMPAELPLPHEKIVGWGKKIGGGLRGIAESAIEHASRTVGGTTPEAWQMLRQDPQGVLGAARKGMTFNELTSKPEATALSEAQAYGRNAQDIIGQNADAAGKEYGQMMEYLKSPEVNGRVSPIERGPYDPPMRGGPSRPQPNLKEITDNPSPGSLLGQPAEPSAHGLGASVEGPSSAGNGRILPTEYGRTGGDHFDVAGKVSKTIEPFLETQTPYKSISQSPRVKADAEVFNGFYNRIKATAENGATPGEVADLMQQMTAEQKAARGMPLSAHLAELKNSLMDALPGDYKIPTIDTPTHGGWSIADTRAGYKSAQDLQRNLKPFTNPQNPIAALKGVARAGGDASQSLKDAITKIPALKALIDKMNVASAGAEFAPKMAPLPRTGLTGAAGLAAAKLLTGGWANIPELAAFGVGASPRLAAEMVGAGRAAPTAIANLIKSNQSKLPPILAALIAKKRAESGQTQ